MANSIQIKRSDVPGKVPLVTDLKSGELALNTYDGKLFLKQTVGSTSTVISLSPLKTSLIDGGSTTNEITGVNALRFDSNSGFALTDLGGGATKVSLDPALLNFDTFKYWASPGQTTLAPSGADTINILAGPGIFITTSNTATKSVTISSPIAAGANLIKTFNILNEFEAPLIGTSIFVPTYPDAIRAIQLVNGQPVMGDLMVGLYRNNEFLNFFSIPSGQFTAKYSGFEYRITPGDYITVNVVGGRGLNFNMALLNSV
jgi:hypothetical protein